MNKQTIWCLIYAQVISIRFHPKNTDVEIEKEILFAKKVADMALEMMEARWPHG